MKALVFKKKKLNKKDKRLIRKARIRAKVRGTNERPRISVFRSNKNIYLQAINDEIGHTLVYSSSLEFKDKKLTGKEKAKKASELLAERLLKLGIKKIVFDRGGYKYHGRIKIIAETLRERGLDF
ncbi:MAG: 50S ribosomal protein L18 [Patescibacteria group bacterium]|nr:50S ribosomal protein L18 [Patescibacteria group bacterium]